MVLGKLPVPGRPTRDVPLTPYFHLTDGNLTKDTYNVLRRL